MTDAADQAVVRVSGLGKRYLLRQTAGRTLKGTILDALLRRRVPPREFWALRDVDFTVPRGETLGIVGANGAGKSTLLALLAGTKAPTTGEIETRGKISSLLELGAGFHPELTGRENVFLAGAIMGLSRARMAGRFEAIVDFAEIGEFIDQPVKHYSSGMYVRLGFAVAVEVDPDILLLDEVLAVGDVGFQAKCLERMETFRKSGKTMLIISHDLETIKSVSDRILFLEEGEVKGLGDPESVVETYDTRVQAGRASGLGREWGTGEVVLTDIAVINVAGEPCETFRFGEDLVAHIGYEAKEEVRQPVFGFSIADAQGRPVYGNNTQLEGVTIDSVRGEGRLTLRIRNLLMAPGSYLLSFSVHSSDHSINYHRLDHCFPITIEGDKTFEGTYMPVEWQV